MHHPNINFTFAYLFCIIHGLGCLRIYKMYLSAHATIIFLDIIIWYTNLNKKKYFCQKSIKIHNYVFGIIISC